MALARPSPPVVTVSLATRPAAHLRGGDRARLVRHVAGAERRLARAVPPSAVRRRLVRHLWRLAERAARAPAREGLVLVACAGGGRHLSLHHPVMDRVLLGTRPPTYEQVVEATWAFGRLGVLRLAAPGPRLVCVDGASLWEPRPPWDPRDPVDLAPPCRSAALRCADRLVRTTLPGRTPLVVAGDDRLVRAFRACGGDRPVAAHLAGDHSETSVATLAALAQRVLRRSLDDHQRAAMASLALAVDRGTAVRGIEAVRAVPAPDRPAVLLVEAGAQRLLRGAPCGSVTGAVHAAGGSLVVVPDGFLAHHDRAALVST